MLSSLPPEVTNAHNSHPEQTHSLGRTVQRPYTAGTGEARTSTRLRRKDINEELGQPKTETDGNHTPGKCRMSERAKWKTFLWDILAEQGGHRTFHRPRERGSPLLLSATSWEVTAGQPPAPEMTAVIAHWAREEARAVASALRVRAGARLACPGAAAAPIGTNIG